MQHRVTAVIFDIKPKQVVNANFIKQEVWLRLGDDKYPQTVCVEFSNKKLDRLAEFENGEEVNVDFELRGREFKGRVYNTLFGTNINPLPKADPARVITQDKIQEMNEGLVNDNPADDLPF